MMFTGRKNNRLDGSVGKSVSGGAADERPLSQARERGFTLMEVLMVAVIIVILVGAGSVSYLEAERRAKENRCDTILQNIALSQKLYSREFGEYALFWELQEQGYIDRQFVMSDDMTHSGNSPPLIPEYMLEWEVSTEAYRVTAVNVLETKDDFNPRWRLIGGLWDLRPMYVDERGVVRWLEDDHPVIR